MNKWISLLSRNFPYPPISWLMDSHTWHIQTPFLKVVERTWRYRLANWGWPLTTNEKRLKALHNHYRGKRAFVIGNGPSLNKCDLHKLKNEITFGVNAIFLNHDNMGFHPTFYVVEDVLVAEDRAPYINQYQGPQVQFFGNYLDYVIADKPDNIWLNVRTNYREYPGFPHFSTSALRQVWVGGTVSYVCLQLAYYLGFDEVYLIGFDHAYHIPKSAEIGGAQMNRITSTEDDPNHFHPDYFGKGYRWHDPQVDRMEKAFSRARAYFEKDHRKIYNATVGGHLEVFERVDYNTLF